MLISFTTVITPMRGSNHNANISQTRMNNRWYSTSFIANESMQLFLIFGMPLQNMRKGQAPFTMSMEAYRAHAIRDRRDAEIEEIKGSCSEGVA